LDFQPFSVLNYYIDLFRKIKNDRQGRFLSISYYDNWLIKYFIVDIKRRLDSISLINKKLDSSIQFIAYHSNPSVYQIVTGFSPTELALK